jgi:hypothetical protein
MNAIKDTMRALVRRKLWPLAVLLVAALVAVPYKLAKDPTIAPAATVAHSSAKSSDGTPIVALADNTATGRKRVLGQAKDPFEPAPLPKSKKKKAKAAATATPAPTSTPDSGSPSGGSEAPPSSAPTNPEPSGTRVPKYAIKVNFGSTQSDPESMTIARLDPLPDADSPVLVYDHAEQGGKVAVFEVTGNVTAEGDGKCYPSASECAELKLHVGDVEFITVTDTGDTSTDAQYQLELLKIYSKATVVADDANGATTTVTSSSQHKR